MEYIFIEAFEELIVELEEAEDASFGVGFAQHEDVVFL